MQMHSRYNHGRGNVMIALAPGDMIITSVANGSTINIRNACEALHLSLTQHAWTVIRHPIQANIQPDTTSILSFRLNSNRSLAWCGTTRGDASPNQDTLILRQSLETLNVTRQRIVEVLDKVDPMRKATHRHQVPHAGARSVDHYSS